MYLKYLLLLLAIFPLHESVLISYIFFSFLILYGENNMDYIVLDNRVSGLSRAMANKYPFYICRLVYKALSISTSLLAVIGV